MQYTLPRDLFDELVKNVGKESAEKLAKSIELVLDNIQKEADREIENKKEILKSELYNELRDELATKEFVRAEVNEVKVEINRLETQIEKIRGEIKQSNLLLRILIAISFFALTFFNPNFITLIEKIFK